MLCDLVLGWFSWSSSDSLSSSQHPESEKRSHPGAKTKSRGLPADRWVSYRWSAFHNSAAVNARGWNCETSVWCVRIQESRVTAIKATYVTLSTLCTPHLYLFLLSLDCLHSLSHFRDKGKVKGPAFVANGRLGAALSPQRKGQCLDGWPLWWTIGWWNSLKWYKPKVWALILAAAFQREECRVHVSPRSPLLFPSTSMNYP